MLSRLSEPGITRVLTEVNSPVRVRWSPVDDRLAVLNLNEQTFELELITINSDGSGYREYPTTLSEISDLEWAPDGSAIFFMFVNFLFRLDLDTGTVTMVYANLNQANGAMSDGTFSLARMDTVAPTATSTPTATATATRTFTPTATSAQAQTETWRFALTRMIDGYQNRYIDVGVLTCDTSSTAGQSGDTPACTFQVTASTRDRFFAKNPIFSPADDRLAYVGEGLELYSVNPIDMQPFQITQDETMYLGTAWSTDGQWLLFDGSFDNNSGSDNVIKAVRSDGSETPLIVSPAGIDAGSPTASSTGDEFAYITFNSGDSELVLSRLSEPGITRVLTEVNSPVRVRWSPVDDRLAVLNLNEQTFELELITINSDGSGYREYPTTLSEISDLEWAPDGSAIFFMFVNFLFRLDLDTGTVTMVYANLNQANGAMSDGTFSLARMDTVAPTATATGEPAPSPTP